MKKKYPEKVVSSKVRQSGWLHSQTSIKLDSFPKLEISELIKKNNKGEFNQYMEWGIVMEGPVKSWLIL